MGGHVEHVDHHRCNRIHARVHRSREPRCPPALRRASLNLVEFLYTRGSEAVLRKIPLCQRSLSCHPLPPEKQADVHDQYRRLAFGPVYPDSSDPRATIEAIQRMSLTNELKSAIEDQWTTYRASSHQLAGVDGDSAPKSLAVTHGVDATRLALYTPCFGKLLRRSSPP